MGLTVVLGTPHLLQELLLGHELAPVADEDLDDRPLGGSETDLVPVAPHLLGCEVDGEVGRRDDRCLLDRRRPAQRGPEAREQLVHAEGLGDVVVGAGVERGDLHGFGVAGGEHDDRHVAPPAQRSGDVDAVDVGQAEIEDNDVGMVTGRELQPLPAVLGTVDLVAARSASGPRRPRRGHDSWLPPLHRQGRPQRGQLHPHRAHRAAATGKLNTMVAPPPGVSSMSSVPAIASTNPRATARPRPIPAPVDRAPRRWKGWNTWSRWSRGVPAPRPTTSTSTSPPAVTAWPRTVWSFGDHASALSITFASARSRSAGSTWTRGRSSGTSSTTSRPRSPRPATARLTTSSTPMSVVAGCSAPA